MAKLTKDTEAPETESNPRPLTKQVDDAFVVRSKEPDGVFEEEHEGCVDDSICQLVGIDLWESNQPGHLSHSFSTLMCCHTTRTHSLHMWTQIERLTAAASAQQQEASP